MTFSKFDDLLTLLDASKPNCLTETIDMKSSEFSFKNTKDPFIKNAITDNKLYLRSDWSVKQFCRLFGITKLFYDRSSSDLSEKIYPEHVQKFSDDLSDMTALIFKDSGAEYYLRSIVPLSYSPFGLSKLLEKVRSYFEHKFKLNFVQSSHMQFVYEPVVDFLCYSTDQDFTLGADKYYPGFYIQASELGAGDLIFTPAYVAESGAFLPVLDGKNSPMVKAKYVGSKEKVSVEKILDESMVQNVEVFDFANNPIRKIPSSGAFSFDSALKMLEDWATRKGFPGGAYKKCLNHVDAWLATRDENGQSADFDSEAHFVSVVLDAVRDADIAVRFKVGMYLSGRYGVTY